MYVYMCVNNGQARATIGKVAVAFTTSVSIFVTKEMNKNKAKRKKTTHKTYTTNSRARSPHIEKKTNEQRKRAWSRDIQTEELREREIKSTQWEDKFPISNRNSKTDSKIHNHNWRAQKRFGICALTIRFFRFVLNISLQNLSLSVVFKATGMNHINEGSSGGVGLHVLLTGLSVTHFRKAFYVFNDTFDVHFFEIFVLGFSDQERLIRIRS